MRADYYNKKITDNHILEIATMTNEQEKKDSFVTLMNRQTKLLHSIITSIKEIDRDVLIVSDTRVKGWLLSTQDRYRKTLGELIKMFDKSDILNTSIYVNPHNIIYAQISVLNKPLNYYLEEVPGFLEKEEIVKGRFQLLGEENINEQNEEQI